MSRKAETTVRKPERIALIPAYEPEDLLLELLFQLKRSGYEIVVVNDGSNAMYDGLFEKAAAFAAVLRHNRNKGKGAALKTGLEYIAKVYSEQDIVVTMDADGQHTVTDARKLAEAASEHPESLILGSRRFSGEVPARSRFGNILTRLVYRIFTGQQVQDTQTELRAFRASHIPRMLKLEGERYEYEMNVLMHYARNKIPITEIPIETIYLNDNASSHFHTWKDSARIYREILKFGASSFISFLIDYVLYAVILVLTEWFTGAGSLLIANIGARIISASVNYTINRTVVFESKVSALKSMLQYTFLAAFMLGINTWLLSTLVNTLGVNRMLAKLAVEASLFVFNFIIQRTIIFPSKTKKTERLHIEEAVS